uniref:Uncharacterized protein n=1 Tax=Chromera velia CCMP2878 TaxID=1169474 RepID=A0A0G4FNG6_9ALVE|eukprot:Cvel_3556.t1-p1 / transcript=Cvel_3556.t1 / gene=Cvel_3556 / organism=Chromera_velia_CCMP2878 / gene_product=hypothetical protein / transcript_product=hypothetical protein / location=Cvel_scaffold145:66000-70066(-) / protein_length=589 / sequence_SO=supercontig / SO=protein_coding / is_pseudo=false
MRLRESRSKCSPGRTNAVPPSEMVHSMHLSWEGGGTYSPPQVFNVSVEEAHPEKRKPRMHLDYLKRTDPGCIQSGNSSETQKLREGIKTDSFSTTLPSPTRRSPDGRTVKEKAWPPGVVGGHDQRVRDQALRMQEAIRRLEMKSDNEVSQMQDQILALADECPEMENILSVIKLHAQKRLSSLEKHHYSTHVPRWTRELQRTVGPQDRLVPVPSASLPSLVATQLSEGFTDPQTHHFFQKYPHAVPEDLPSPAQPEIVSPSLAGRLTKEARRLSTQIPGDRALSLPGPTAFVPPHGPAAPLASSAERDRGGTRGFSRESSARGHRKVPRVLTVPSNSSPLAAPKYRFKVEKQSGVELSTEGARTVTVSTPLPSSVTPVFSSSGTSASGGRESPSPAFFKQDAGEAGGKPGGTWKLSPQVPHVLCPRTVFRGAAFTDSPAACEAMQKDPDCLWASSDKDRILAAEREERRKAEEKLFMTGALAVQSLRPSQQWPGVFVQTGDVSSSSAAHPTRKEDSMSLHPPTIRHVPPIVNLPREAAEERATGCVRGVRFPVSKPECPWLADRFMSADLSGIRRVSEGLRQLGRTLAG